ncbi:MAG TPA: hypothetical protein VGC41_27005 [Kofleriaceae bacterium]
MKLVLAVLLLAATAHAGQRRSARKLTVVSDDQAAIQLVVTSKSSVPREEIVAVEVPHAYVVTGVSYGGYAALVTEILDRDAAWDRYTAIVALEQDPAIVEWLGEDRVLVRVFPVERGQPVPVTLVLGKRSTDVAHVSRETSFVTQPARFVTFATYWPPHRATLPR